ncbi:uncharacterized protein METZ01_LOCUS386706, partial [marine metagenome]
MNDPMDMSASNEHALDLRTGEVNLCARFLKKVIKSPSWGG